MHSFTLIAAVLATLLGLANMANAGVVNRGEYQADSLSDLAPTPTILAATTGTDIGEGSSAPTGICCFPGCKYCARQACTGNGCDNATFFTSCCSEFSLLEDTIFVRDINDPRLRDALSSPSPTPDPPSTLGDEPVDNIAVHALGGQRGINPNDAHGQTYDRHD